MNRLPGFCLRLDLVEFYPVSGYHRPGPGSDPGSGHRHRDHLHGHLHDHHRNFRLNPVH